MPSLADLLADLSARDDDDAPDAPKPLPEALVMTLREAYANFAEPCPFKPGDLVTPRAGYNIKDAGSPVIVVEVMDAPRNFEADEPSAIGSPHWGSKRNVRVLEVAEGRAVVSFWYEHWQLEPYSGA